MVERKDVIIQIEVIYFLDRLIEQLYDFNYFSYKENASIYIYKIYDFFENDIHTFPHKSTPEKLSYLGSNYIFYRSNARTTWYIFFQKIDANYFVTGILNNHCEEAQFI